MKLPPIHLNAPAAIAFSGGGDSTALLHACRDNPNINHAFIIDHGFRADSAEEVTHAAEFARSLGYKVKSQRWSHDGVSTGIQVKARKYRYAAMGDMCRAAGLKHLVTGHTEDDQAETILMRLDRHTGWRGLAGMPEAAYGPLWPALAGVTLHRPWLNVSRADIRQYNAENSLRFVDDPSNENTDFTRVRARQALRADVELRSELIEQQKIARSRLSAERKNFSVWMKDHAVMNPHGFIETKALPSSELLLHILNAVSGQGGPIDAAKRASLCAEMESPDFKAATLSGAWVIRKTQNTGHTYVFVRDRVAVAGRHGITAVPSAELKKQQLTVWDGRFFCKAKTDNVKIITALGHINKLRQVTDFKELSNLPAEVRSTLPVFLHQGKPIGFGACDTEFVSSRACSASRLQALFPNPDSVSIYTV
ncbi:MAG: tRNA lysidine(34) synthetase TilS [Litorimonas sp.]